MSSSRNNKTVLSMGIHSMWGFSPAMDMLSTLPKEVLQGDDDYSPINILIMYGSDIRHVLQTISSRHRHTSRPVNIYLYEPTVEVLARHVLMLQIAQDWEVPLRHRCNTFLEVFGNALVQSRTSDYISEQSRALVLFVYNDEDDEEDSLISLSDLKMKQRDELVQVFQSWDTKVEFDVKKLRDQRLRNHYETRYDHRKNLIDWDYTMALKPIEDASVIHTKQYRHWRDTGVAFEFGDQMYDVPNRTMASFAEATERGRGLTRRRGFWLDIVISPYISFGVGLVNKDGANAYARELFDVHNKGSGVEQNRHNTVEVAVFNMLSMMYEIETKKRYEMKTRHKVYSGLGESSSGDATEEEESKIVELVDEEQRIDPKEALERAECICSTMSGLKVIPLMCKKQDLFSKKKYAKKFDHVFLSSQIAHVISEKKEAGDTTVAEFVNVLKPNASVSVESSVYLLPLSKEQRVAYMTKICDMATEAKLTPKFKWSSGSASEDDITKAKNSILSFSYVQ